MGAKTEMLAFAAGDIADVLHRPGVSDPAAAEELVRRLAPGWQVEPAEGESLAEATYPPEDTVYGLSIPGLDLVCGLGYLRRSGSSLPEHVLEEGVGRRIVVHRMHSGVDGCEFALWSEGVLVRAIGIDGVNGVVEDIGDPLPFEAPFWSGRHPHEPEKWWASMGSA